MADTVGDSDLHPLIAFGLYDSVPEGLFKPLRASIISGGVHYQYGGVSELASNVWF